MTSPHPDQGPVRRAVLRRLVVRLAGGVVQGAGVAWALGPAPASAADDDPAPGLWAWPPELGKPGTGLSRQGGLRFRYWGFHVYDAQLFVGPGFDPDRPLAHRLALSLTYARALSARDIAERSLQEIARQGTVDEAQSRRWQAQLARVLVDVKRGDRLTGVYQPQPARASFFHNGVATGDLDDALLAERFFGIWLSLQTSQPALRRALLGLGERTGGGAGAPR